MPGVSALYKPASWRVLLYQFKKLTALSYYFSTSFTAVSVIYFKFPFSTNFDRLIIRISTKLGLKMGDIVFSSFDFLQWGYNLVRFKFRNCRMMLLIILWDFVLNQSFGVDFLLILPALDVLCSTFNSQIDLELSITYYLFVVNMLTK